MSAPVVHKSGSISVHVVASGTRRKRSTSTTSDRLVNCVVQRTSRVLLKPCSVKWTTYRSSVTHATITKPNKRKMKTAPVVPEALEPKKSVDAVDYKQKYDEAIHFIEMTEALTYDPKTQARIRNYLIAEGVWPPITKKG